MPALTEFTSASNLKKKKKPKNVKKKEKKR